MLLLLWEFSHKVAISLTFIDATTSSVVNCVAGSGRFNALDVRLYVGPRVDLWVLQGSTVTGGH